MTKIASFDQSATFENAKTKLVAALQSSLPAETPSGRLVVDKVWVDDTLDPWDLNSQLQAKAAGRTWGVPVYGAFHVVDKDGNEVSRSKKLRLLTLPKITPRGSFIVEGNEQQVINQMRLEPGVYTRVQKNKGIEAQINLSRGGRGVGPRLVYDPKKENFLLKAKSSHVPIHPVLNLLGVPDEEISDRLGEDLFSQIRSNRPEAALSKLYRAIYGEEPDPDTMHDRLREYFDNTEISPENTKITLGRPHSKMNGPLLLDAAAKVARVLRGEEEPDDRDALHFKSIHSFDDFMAERIQKNTHMLQRSVRKGLEQNPKDIARVVRPDRVDKLFRNFISGAESSLSQNVTQINPLEMLSGVGKITIHGEGGVTNRNQITPEQRNINPTHFGLIDPIHAPEGGDIGTSLHLSIGASKKDAELLASVLDPKTGRRSNVSMKAMWDSHVAFPGEYEKSGSGAGAWKPVRTKVRAYYQGKIVEAPAADIDYLLDSPQNLFDYSVNLIPFLNSISGARAMMAAKHQEQAVSLKHRQAPLVQSKGVNGETFEATVGKMAQAITSPVAGTVKKINPDSIEIAGSDGKRQKVQLYSNFFLNGKTSLNNEPIVSEGDTVKAGQVIADSNFTRGGELALGINARVAYVPYQGLNFEDGVVISDSMSKRLTSEHLYRFESPADPNVRHDVTTYRAFYNDSFTPDQYQTLDNEGVAKEGTTLVRGDPIILRLVHREGGNELSQKIFGRSKVTEYSNKQVMTWREDFQGTVVSVHKTGGRITVLVKTEEPAQQGDKVSNRSASKGIITKIVPDERMPRDAEGRPIEIILNPVGVPSRINPSQILEAAAGKAADKLGRTVVVDNFGNANNVAFARDLLNEADLDDLEDLYDPERERTIPGVFVGNAHILKLDFPIRKKFSARSTGTYTSDLAPSKHGEESAQSIDFLTAMSLLAHGAYENLREASTVKAGKSDEFFRAIELGEPLPPPQVPETVKRFEAMLAALGVNVHKEGSRMRLMPLTNQEIIGMSSGEVTESTRLRGTDLKPDRGGIFDPMLTGGRKGEKWAHVALAEPMPNPVFENAILWLTGLKGNDYAEIIAGRSFVDPSTGAVSTEDTGLTGGNAIKALLERIDVTKEIQETRQQISTAREDELDKLNRKLRVLTNLKVQDVAPTEFMLKHVPVIPPKYRPVYPTDDGRLISSGLNDLYRDLIMANNSRRNRNTEYLPARFQESSRETLYGAMKAVMGFGSALSRRDQKGIFEVLKGEKNKEGWFQSHLVKKTQELTGRSTITVDQGLGVDEVAIPERMAWTIMKPFVLGEMRRLYGYGPLEAEDQWRDQTERARIALENVMETKPVLLNRAPSLHKHSILAMRPKLSPDLSIKLNPFVMKGFAADLDGDTMSVHVPISQEAEAEARRMFPSQNFLSTSGEFLLEPRHESQAGLYIATKAARRVDREFKNDVEALEAYTRRELNVNDEVKVAGQWRTIGSLAIDAVLPPAARLGGSTLTGKKTIALLEAVANGNPKALPNVLSVLKDLGNDAAYETGLTVSLKDLEDGTKLRRERDQIMNAAKKRLDVANREASTDEQRRANFSSVMGEADTQIGDMVRRGIPDTNNLRIMMDSGARGNLAKLQQFLGAPVMVEDISRRPFPFPVDRNYAEGMDMPGYWATLYGARMGIIDRAKSTVEPGALNKSLLATAIDYSITAADCGTTRGRVLSIENPDIYGRYIAEAVGGVSRDQILTADVVGDLERKGVKQVKVRTPIYCETPSGVCSKCYGTDELGRPMPKGFNVGVVGGQSLTEPMTQMVLSSFHTGGTVKSADQMASTKLEAIRSLLELPNGPRNKADVAMISGAIETVEESPAGGYNVRIAGKSHSIPPRKELLDSVKPGSIVEAGEALTTGIKDPRDIMKLKGPYATRLYIADTLRDIYAGGNGKRIPLKHFETIASAVINTTRILDAPENSDLLPGDFAPLDRINQLNTTVPPRTLPIRQAAGSALLEDIEAVGGLGKILSSADLDTLERLGKSHVSVNPMPIVHKPMIKGINLLPTTRKDWLSALAFRNLEKVMTTAPAEGWTTDLAGSNPLPAYIYGALDPPDGDAQFARP
jgi:DNA-directed RNA polymerase subunit beta'